MATIEILGVSHSYTGPDGEFAVKDVNITWKDGSANALLGPSGCGKTTLLNITSGLLAPSRGRVLFDGRDVTRLQPEERNIAQVFQFPVVYDTMNVFDNLAFPLRNRGMNEATVRRRVHEVAEVLEIESMLRRRAHHLGADDKQKVSLGRGIVREDTRAVLFDEPLTMIDPHVKWLLRRKIKQVQNRLGLTMIYVTHDQHEALSFADQVSVLNEGRVLQTGTPRDLHERPQAPFVGHFIGSPGMNLFDCDITKHGLRVGSHEMAVSAARHAQLIRHDGQLRLGIRPEHLETSREGREGWAKTRIALLEFTGTALIATLEGAGLAFKVRLQANAPAAEGDTLWVNFPEERIMVYEENRAVKSPGEVDEVVESG